VVLPTMAPAQVLATAAIKNYADHT
jgi:hypothetical protein